MANTLDLFVWLGLIAALWTVREFLFGLWAWRKARRFVHVQKVESTRGQFATVRNSLSRLAVNERLTAHSETFQRLYYVNTVFMRSPDRYPQLGKAVHQAILNSKNMKPNEELLQESKTWTPEVRQLVRHTADAMQQVLIDYSWFFRVYFYMASKRWKAAEKFRSHAKKAAQKVVGWVEKRHPIILDIRMAQDAMYHMAS